MPEVREVFEMIAEQVEPDRDSWRQQERRRRRVTRNRKLGTLGVAAAIGIASVAIVIRIGGGQREWPRLPAGVPVNEGLARVDVETGGITPLPITPSDSLDFAVSPDGTRMAFSSAFSSDHFEIFVINLDGASLRRLTDDPLDARLPAWSPDGSKIAYTGSATGTEWDIFMVDADGGSPIQVTEDPLDDLIPMWSPDGTEIAFARTDFFQRSEAAGLVSRRPGSPQYAGSYTSQLVAVSIADGSERVVQQDASPPLGGWSPDGRILFSRIGDGFWTVNADGSDAQPIDLPDFPADAGGPRLSPDGSSLAFNVLVDGNSEVQVRDLATGRTRLVVHRANLPTWSPSGNEILVIGGPTSAEHPGAVTGSFVLVDTATGETRDAPGLSQAAFDLDFSPEGRTVVYASEETGRRQIYTFDISTGEVHQLTSGLEAGAPTWSPDGRTIAYTEFVDGRRAIVTVPADRLERRTILPATTDAIHPSFSPDGSEIAYNALLGPDQGIFVFDLSAGEVQRLTSGPDVNPDWSPDRDVLVFEHGEAGKFELWTVRPDGTGARRLYTAETSTGLPKFDPSGTSIAFLQGSGDGRFDLYVLDMATGDARFVLAGVEAFAWDPSGQLLVKTIS